MSEIQIGDYVSIQYTDGKGHPIQTGVVRYEVKDVDGALIRIEERGELKGELSPWLSVFSFVKVSV